MAIDPIVQRMSPKKRERWAFVFLAFLGLLALLWAINIYWLRPSRMENRLIHERAPRASGTVELSTGQN